MKIHNTVTLALYLKKKKMSKLFLQNKKINILQNKGALRFRLHAYREKSR